MVGLPGSGKSTIAKLINKGHHAEIFSSDALREELYGDVNDQKHNQKVFAELHRRIKACLKSGKDAVYDACNVSSKRRMAFLREIKNIHCKKICIIAAAPYEVCLENNLKRDRHVPQWAIERMYRQWNTPYWFEGWDDIQLDYSDYGSYSVQGWLNDHASYAQDNPHHALSLSAHCVRCASSLYNTPCRTNYRKTLIIAGLIHDCGKPFCKQFKDVKGNGCDIAHYYDHENVGAYDTLFFQYSSYIDTLTVSVLVNLHMRPYAWERDDNKKLQEKNKELWGDTLYSLVMSLHEADKTAH